MGVTFSVNLNRHVFVMILISFTELPPVCTRKIASGGLSAPQALYERQSTLKCQKKWSRGEQTLPFKGSLIFRIHRKNMPIILIPLNPTFIW